MTAVSHFQRFSQRENHATNNTLLVLRHLYQTAPGKLEAVLHDLLEDTQIAIGVQFDQQIRGVRSVPDGHISQRPWSIFVETKLGNDLGEDQIERHIESIAARKHVGASVLLGLTSGTPDRMREERMAELARQHNVTFKWTTFRELADALGKQCAEYETALSVIVADYVEYLREEGLMDSRDDWLLVVPCGQSYDENKRFGLYYDGVNRPSRKGARYLGIYKNRMVSLMGDIVAVLVCSYRDGQVVLEQEEFGKASADHLARVKAVIEATTYYDLKGTTQRYFITDGLHETAIAKSAKSGIQGALYLNLDALLGKRRPATWDMAQLAEAVRGKSFPTAE